MTANFRVPFELTTSNMPISNDDSHSVTPEPASMAVGARCLKARMRSLRHLEAARGYLDLEMPGHALRELDEIGKNYPFQQARLRGEALCDLNQFDKARAAFAQALEECPRSRPILMGLATCDQRQNRLDDAITTLEKANLIHPQQPAVLFSLARCAALRDDIEGALTWLGRAMRMCPDVAVWAESDPDFASLRTLPDFVWFVEFAKLRVDAA